MAASNNDITPIAPTQSVQLDLPPSCVEFCPAFPSYFLIGTYNLQKDDAPAPESDDGGGDDAFQSATPAKTQSRNGSVIVFRLANKTL